MIKNVDILLCDEPTGSLDENNAKIIFDILKREAKERLVIVITHDEQLASQYGDYIYSFQNGKLIGKYHNIEDNNFYYRLKEKKSSLNLFKLSLLQYRANFRRNTKIVIGLMMALICIMITFTLSGSLQQQIRKQLNNIFPNQLVSLQSISRKGLNYKDLVELTNNQDITYLYGEMRDFEFIGISLQKDYNIDRTIYISDMTKELKNNQLEIGRNIKSDYEIILSKTTAVHLKQDYKKLLNRYVYGYYLQGDSIKKVRLKVVGISGENTIFDTIYINELANVKHVSECFNINIDQIYFSIGMINIDNKVNVNSSLKKLKKKYFNLEFKVAGENISNKINDFLLQTQRILILFSSLAVVAACFLIGEVLYLSVVQKTKDIGIFKCLGASKLQLKLLVLFESFILINIAFLVSYLSFCQLIGFINQFIEEGLQLDLSQSFIQVDNYLLGLIYFGALFFGVISSYFPARFASNLDPVKALKYQRY